MNVNKRKNLQGHIIEYLETQQRNETVTGETVTREQGEGQESSRQTGRTTSGENTASREQNETESGKGQKLDLFSQDTQSAQALKDAERAKDAKRNTGVDDADESTLTGSTEGESNVNTTGKQAKTQEQESPSGSSRRLDDLIGVQTTLSDTDINELSRIGDVESIRKDAQIKLSAWATPSDANTRAD